MNKEFLKRILPVMVLILFLIPIITSSLLDLKQRERNALIEQKLLTEQKAVKDAEDKIYLMGKFDPAQREDFILIPNEFNVGGYRMYLRRETLSAFLKMETAASKDEIELKIASATRNFDYQKNIWNNKWSGVTAVNGKNLSISIPDGLERFNKILEYSATPGTSRHHWGTDIDINAATPEYFKGEPGRKVYDWLVKNAGQFGFCQTYNLKDSFRPTGYNEEKWHWSYLPLSKNFTEQYKNLIKDEDIKGFDGDEYAPELGLIKNYVLSINSDCI